MTSAQSLLSQIGDKNIETTIYIGNLDERCTEHILWELFVQAGQVVNVTIPRDRVTTSHSGYGFVEFANQTDAEYAVKIMNMIRLYGKPLKVNRATIDKKSLDIGANLFVGSLDPSVDEKILQDAFSVFGNVLSTKIVRDDETASPKGFGFVSFDNFESSDNAIDSMHGRFLCNRPISVSYAFKKDSKGERHGTAAERLLAEQAKKNNVSLIPKEAQVEQIGISQNLKNV